MPAVSSLLRPRVLSAGAMAAVGLLALTGCAGAAGPEMSASGGSGSVGPTASATSSAPSPSAPTASSTPASPSETQATPTGADALPIGEEQWVVGTLTRGGKPVDTGQWSQAFIETDKPFILAVPDLCPQPRFGITKVSETEWTATPDVAQPAVGCTAETPAVGALRELFDGTVKVTPPAGASMEMRMERGDVVLVLGIEG